MARPPRLCRVECFGDPTGANLQGQFVANHNMIAAAALIAAIPTLVVYVLLQKQFIAGLSLGSSKG